MFDPNIPRWITASINTYLKSNSMKIPVYLNSYKGDKEWAEIRISGLNVENYEYSSWKMIVEISLLITSFCAEDQYRIDRAVGVFGSMLDSDICCFRYGNDPQDDGSPLMTLQMYPSKDRKIDIIHFGLISAESKFTRSCVEASYSGWFDGIGS
jgi:hypothetical protein